MHFHCRVWYHVLFLRYACIRSSGITLIPLATFVPNLVSFMASIAELAHGENRILNQSLNQSLTHSLTHSLTQSPSLFDAAGTEAFASELAILDSQHKLQILQV